MGNYYRLKNMNNPSYNGRTIQTVGPQDREYLEPITEAEYLDARSKEDAEILSAGGH